MSLVVVGGVAAGLSAAARARRLDPKLDITVLEKGEHISWAACGLPYLISGHVRQKENLVRFTAEQFARERGVTVRTGTEVVSIQPARRQVTLRSGQAVHFDKLVIATGARTRTKGIEGARQRHVFQLQSMEEAEKARGFARGLPAGSRATVIGAGYLGLEAAEVLRWCGLRVTVVSASRNVLGREDAALTELVSRHLERCGIALETGRTVRSIDESLGAMVMLATGFQPNSEIAAEAGIALSRASEAVVVNERMETNVDGVYAAGDCAETWHRVSARPVYLPLGATANKMGRVAGANAAGHRERFPGVVGTSLVRVCGLDIGVTGLSAAMASEAGFEPVSAAVEASSRARYYRHGTGGFGARQVRVELVGDKRTGRLLGGTVVGEDGVPGRVNVIATALAQRMTVDEFQYLDLGYTPPLATVMDPLLIAAQQLVKQS